VLAQLEYQAGQAEVWRDAVTNWFHTASGIADAKGRVSRYPGRVEAESMQLEGYASVAVTPAEDASDGKAVSCPVVRCSAAFAVDSPAGQYTIRVQYFDQNNGASHLRALVGAQLVDEWTAADRLPSAKLDSTSSTRRSIPGIALRPGDQIRIEAVPDGKETAALDYVELIPEKH
jgi:alpha-glucuronidase